MTRAGGIVAFTCVVACSGESFSSRAETSPDGAASSSSTGGVDNTGGRASSSSTGGVDNTGGRASSSSTGGVDNTGGRAPSSSGGYSGLGDAGATFPWHGFKPCEQQADCAAFCAGAPHVACNRFCLCEYDVQYCPSCPDGALCVNGSCLPAVCDTSFPGATSATCIAQNNAQCCPAGPVSYAYRDGKTFTIAGYCAPSCP